MGLGFFRRRATLIRRLGFDTDRTLLGIRNLSLVLALLCDFINYVKPRQKPLEVCGSEWIAHSRSDRDWLGRRGRTILGAKILRHRGIHSVTFRADAYGNDEAIVGHHCTGAIFRPRGTCVLTQLERARMLPIPRVIADAKS